MVNSILCAIDFTEFSASVVKQAILKANEFKVPLTIIFSYRLKEIEGVEDVVELRAKIERQAKANFTRIEKELLQKQDIPYKFSIEVGFLSDRIDSYLKKDKNTLLVIGQSLVKSMDEFSHEHFIDALQIPVVRVKDFNSAA